MYDRKSAKEGRNEQKYCAHCVATNGSPRDRYLHKPFIGRDSGMNEYSVATLATHKSLQVPGSRQSEYL